MELFTLISGMKEFTCVCGVLSGHEGRSGRSAQSRHVVAVQNDSIVSQRVDVRRWDLGRPMEAYVIPSLNRPHNIL
jgi:hypothetical protein